MKRALIIGISGQDGAYLAEFLLSKGYSVWGTSRDAQLSPFRGLLRLGIIDQVNKLSMSPTDFRSVLQAITQSEPDEIYNLSGQSSVGLSFEQPVETLESISLGVVNILEAIRFVDKSIRFYNASSSEAFGDTGGEPAEEFTPFRPRSPYAVAKAAATWQVAVYRESYGLFACSGILFNHESPLRPARYVTKKIISAACRIANGSREKLSLGSAAVRRDWGWAPEYVDAMWRMLNLCSPEDFVIATGETHSLLEFVEYAFRHVGEDWREHVIHDDSLIRPSEIMTSAGNPSKAYQKLGWQAKTAMPGVVSAMIADELQHHRDGGLLESVRTL
jgi:GDPmannose 4,6-dehydratase